MTTYAELTQQILDYTEVSTDVLTSTRTDDFIEHTENRILRDIDIDALVAFHKSHGKMVTVSAVRPAVRFGELELDGEIVKSFQS